MRGRRQRRIRLPRPVRTLSGDGSGDVTQVDGTTVTWVDAVGEMNSVLNSLTTWYYELVGDNLPVLMQRQ